jgi:hypothetical protein
VNPGLLWRVGHGFAVGSRVGFLLNPDQTKNAQFGITPLIVKSWPIEHSFFRGYFVEGDFIFRFNRPVDAPATNPFTFNMVFGSRQSPIGASSRYPISANGDPALSHDCKVGAPHTSTSAQPAAIRRFCQIRDPDSPHGARHHRPAAIPNCATT